MSTSHVISSHQEYNPSSPTLIPRGTPITSTNTPVLRIAIIPLILALRARGGIAVCALVLDLIRRIVLAALGVGVEARGFLVVA